MSLSPPRSARSRAIAQPARDGLAPGIIVIHDAFGLVDHIKDLCQRFANIGFNAIAPDLYTHTGAPIPGDMASLFSIMLGLDDARAVKTWNDARRWCAASTTRQTRSA